MGWMDLSCQGSDFYRTPNVDRLAREGIRFTNGYAACAVLLTDPSCGANWTLSTPVEL